MVELLEETIENCYSPIPIGQKMTKVDQDMGKAKFRMAAPPTFEDVIRIAEELVTPIGGLNELFDLIGKDNVVKGLKVQGEEKFRNTLSIFYKIGIANSIQYITILNDSRLIGKKNIIKDFTRGPYSIARTVESLHNKEVGIEDLYIIIPRLRDAIGKESVDKGFPSWSLYYFFVALTKITIIGVDAFFSIIKMLKELFGEENVCEAYEQGYLWFVEAIEILSQVGIINCKDLINDLRIKSNRYYFKKLFAHNPRSFAKYIAIKAECTDREIIIKLSDNDLTSDTVIALLRDILDVFFIDKAYLALAPSELIAFVFDTVIKYIDKETHERIAGFLRDKYFSGLSKRNAFSLLREIGPEIEIQKGLESYDVETAHMTAFFFLVESSGDALIEFPLGPAQYHGTLSEIIASMGKLRVGEEFLIPKNKVIPLDVSISVPPAIISNCEFQQKATLLRIVNDLLFTASVRLATAFKACPQDQSGIRFKNGLAKVISSNGTDLAENRSGNLITNDLEDSVSNPLVAHSASFEFYQLMYSALITIFKKETIETEFDKKLKDIYFSFEKEVLGILKENEVEYLLDINSNENTAFLELSRVRTSNPNLTVKLERSVQNNLALINHEVLAEAIRSRMRQVKYESNDIHLAIELEIMIQMDIDHSYGNALQKAFRRLSNSFQT